MGGGKKIELQITRDTIIVTPALLLKCYKHRCVKNIEKSEANKTTSIYVKILTR